MNTASFGSYVDLVDTRQRLEKRLGKWGAMVVALTRVLRHTEFLLRRPGDPFTVEGGRRGDLIALAVLFFPTIVVQQFSASDAYRAAVEALKHPAAGVRKAAAMVLPKSPGAGSALVAAGLFAAGAITVRMLAQRDSTQSMVFWFMVLLSLGALLLALPTWKPPWTLSTG